MRRPVRVGGVGVLPWKDRNMGVLLPPARPRGVLGNQGDTPWNPRQRGHAPSAKGGQV